MTRADFQRLANERIAHTKALLAARRWAAAYYLAGYAGECGFKACILARVATATEIRFDDERFSEKCWTHNLPQLLDLAGLKGTLAADAAADPERLARWDAVKDRTESTQYTRKTKAKAEELYDAITDKKHGVLSWIKGHW